MIAGYLTVRDAAIKAGLSRATIYNRILHREIERKLVPYSGRFYDRINVLPLRAVITLKKKKPGPKPKREVPHE